MRCPTVSRQRYAPIAPICRSSARRSRRPRQPGGARRRHGDPRGAARAHGLQRDGQRRDGRHVQARRHAAATTTKEALGALIGRKGERLSALQHLVNLMLSREMGAWTRVLVDVEDYRGRRERQLREIATVPRSASSRPARCSSSSRCLHSSAAGSTWPCEQPGRLDAIDRRGAAPPRGDPQAPVSPLNERIIRARLNRPLGCRFQREWCFLAPLVTR